MEEPWHYRNKAQFPVGYDKEGNLVAGFYAGRTHSIVANTNCAIQAEVTHPIVEKVLTYMKENKISAYDEKNHSGLVRHILTRIGFTTGEIMVCLIVNGTKKQLKHIDKLVDDLKTIEGMTSIIVNTNTDKTNKILGLRCETVWGQDYIEDYIGNIKYQIGPLSFYQVNPEQTEKLYSKAVSCAELKKGDKVIDAYCGTGTIGLIAAKSGADVAGVELNAEAVKDAVSNAKLNKLDNIRFYNEDAGEFMTKLAQAGESCDTVFLDPPRAGTTEEFVEALGKLRPEKIVYVSCKIETLERDLKLLAKIGYKAQLIQPVDMFPHTTGIENVVLLKRKMISLTPNRTPDKKGDKKIERKGKTSHR